MIAAHILAMPCLLPQIGSLRSQLVAWAGIDFLRAMNDLRQGLYTLGCDCYPLLWSEAAPALACPNQLKSMIGAGPAPAIILIILFLGPSSSRGGPFAVAAARSLS
jgi:hypothetical protein